MPNELKSLTSPKINPEIILDNAKRLCNSHRQMSTNVTTETAERLPEKTAEHQAIEIVGNDGKKHFIWARSAKDTYQDATRWSYRHNGLDSVSLLVALDDREGCWDRARRVPFGRQCNLPTILENAKS